MKEDKKYLKCLIGDGLLCYLSSPNDEDVYKDYWVFWEAGTIQVGTGHTLFKDTFLNYTDPSPERVSVVGIHSGWGPAADWIFYAGKKIVHCNKTSPHDY